MFAYKIKLKNMGLARLHLGIGAICIENEPICCLPLSKRILHLIQFSWMRVLAATKARRARAEAGENALPEKV